jgi:hypothetical protein
VKEQATAVQIGSIPTSSNGRDSSTKARRLTISDIRSGTKLGALSVDGGSDYVPVSALAGNGGPTGFKTGVGDGNRSGSGLSSCVANRKWSKWPSKASSSTTRSVFIGSRWRPNVARSDAGKCEIVVSQCGCYKDRIVPRSAPSIWEWWRFTERDVPGCLHGKYINVRVEQKKDSHLLVRGRR